MRLVALLLVACSSARPLTPLELAQVEGRRQVTDRLVAVARKGDARALRALGRIGGDEAIAALSDVLRHDAGPAAVEGLWYAGAGAPEVARAYRGDGSAQDLAVVRALGRLATAAEMPVLERALAAPDPAVRDAAGVAAGVAGRRKVAFTDGVRAALAHNLAADRSTGAVYGLAYDPQPAPVAALASFDGPPAARALLQRALAARGGDTSKGLDDPDVWVRVEAERGLAGTAAGRARLAAWILAEWSAIGDTEERLTSERLHPILDGLARLAPFAAEPPVGDALAKLRELTDVSRSTERERYTPGMLLAIDAVNCFAAAGLVRRGAALATLAACGEPSGRGWPLWARRQLLAAAVKDHVGSPDERLAAVEAMWKDPDARTRAAAAEAAAAILPGADAILRDALGSRDVAVAENAADGLAAAGDKAPPWAGAALAARADTAKDEPELYQSILDALVAVHAPAAEAVLERAAADPNPAVRAKARAALGARAPAATPTPAPLPPDDAATVLGAHPVLTVTTSKGLFHVELDAELAPWNVATLVALAGKHFYDGVVWHRVVAGFVVQGGDPTGTGAGGPGYTVVAEPSSARYDRGAVGIADAGKDTGGSQFFVALAPAPHLDGRYTVVGHVPDADMAVVDRLQVGDLIVKLEVVR
jgi:cyclophilin family peptidyl-prolyl cis-trans isomerase/HEAT repeat protein